LAGVSVDEHDIATPEIAEFGQPLLQRCHPTGLVLQGRRLEDADPPDFPYRLVLPGDRHGEEADGENDREPD